MKSPETLFLYKTISIQIWDRLIDRHIRRRIVAWLYIVMTLFYLIWRTTIINEDSLFLSLTYYFAEWLGFILALTMIFSGWTYYHRPPLPVETAVSVDVLVPVYREPLDVIRRTLIAAKNIEYPHKTFVLDDGNRSEVGMLALDLGIQYLCRGKNIGAKAGNLNFGLQHSNSDFVAVFDADHIAQPHALHALLGFFKDPKVAMVQSPQDYYNIDAFQYMNPKNHAGLWHDQSWFYNIAQPFKDSHNAASCVGTGVVYRRAALDTIGGIPSETVTEDIHTSLKLHKSGFETVYLNESVAYGIAAADLDEYYKTRLRWAHGNLEALKIENIFTCKGLSLKQRLSYLSLGLIYLEGWQQLLLFMVPIIALSFGWAPFEITPVNVLAVLFFPIFSTLLLQEYGAGLSRYWTNEIFSMARWPVHIMASFSLLGKKIAWKTSSKNIQGKINWRLMSPQIVLVICNLSALVIAFFRLNGDYSFGPLAQLMVDLWHSLQGGVSIVDSDWNASMMGGYSIDLVAVAGFWALFNSFRAIFFVLKALHNARESHPFFRFSLSFPVSFVDHPGEYAVTERVAEDWVRIKNLSDDGRLGSHPELKIKLLLPAGEMSATIMVVQQGANWLEGRFNWPNEVAADSLANALYSLGWQREFQTHQAFFLTPLDYLLKPYVLLRRHLVWHPAAREWEPIRLCISESEIPEFALIALPSKDHKPGYLITFSLLQLGQHYRTARIADNGYVYRDIVIIERQAISALRHKGLDGKRYYRYGIKSL